MSAFLDSSSQSLRAIWRGLRAPGLYLLLALSLIAWALAYQYKTAYTIDLGGLDDNAFVSHFHDKEHNESLTYRWSDVVSEVVFPGVGNQPVLLTVNLVGFRPEGTPPTVRMEARGQTFEVQTRQEPSSETRLVERGDPLDGDIRLVISSPTFSPPNDPRRLGVIVDSVTLAPADYGLRPLVYPSLGALAGLLLSLLGVYLALLITTRRVLYALWAVVACSIAATCLIVLARLELGLLAGQLPLLLAWSLLFAVTGRALLDMLIPQDTSGAEFAVGAGSTAFVAAFLLRFGGATYPQFLSSDLLLHVHNVQQVLGGRWLFTEPLPDGTPVPYPNALYVMLSPFAALLGPSDETTGLLLKWSGSLFDAVTCLALAWAVSRLWMGGVGGWSALAYAVSPAPFILLSAGNYSNIFAQTALNVTLLGGMLWLDDRKTIVHRPSSIVLLFAGFCLTALGHYGMMLATLGIIGTFAVWIIYLTVRRVPVSRAWALIGAWGASLVTAFVLYYWHFTDEVWRQWSGAFNRLSDGTSGASGSDNGLADFVSKRVGWLGPVALITAVFGATQTSNLARLSRALLWSWLLAVVIFALLDRTVGDTVRWFYLGAVPVALFSGCYLGLLSRRGRVAILLAALTLTSMLFHTLGFWVGDLIFVRYH